MEKLGTPNGLVGRRGAFPVLGLGLLSLAAAASLSLACSSSRGPDPATAGDPERQADAEYDIARDLFLNRHEPRAALKHALKAVELDDEHADAAHLISLIYLYFCATGPADCHFEEAERYVRLALDSRKDFREAKNTLGVVLVHQKRYAEAIAALEPLANDILYATPETAWGNLGWAYLLSGRTDKAIEALQRAIALQPDFCVGAYRLGLAYEKKGDFKAAREALSRALETDRRECTGLLDAYKARARVAMRLGDPEAARGDLERCKELAGDDTSAAQACAAKLEKPE